MSVEESGRTSANECDVAAAVVNNTEVPGAQIELYNSRSTCHLSPYRADFTNYKDTPACAFKMANNQPFNTTGHGDIVIEVPNGGEITWMLLCDVLYAPEVSYMLVSIGKLDKSGYQALFGSSQMKLTNPEGQR